MLRCIMSTRIPTLIQTYNLLLLSSSLSVLYEKTTSKQSKNKYIHILPLYLLYLISILLLTLLQ
jgi:hypothetical protein